MTSETLRKMLVKQEPRNICCYVCAGPKADCPLYSKPYGNRPYFPFFERHSLPEGADPITADGRALVCNLCYVILTQQWSAFEKTRTPQSKRIYWLKRLDNGAFAGMDVNLQQDYESLFDASHGSLDADPRPKHRSSRNTHTPEARKTPKFPVRSESRDSSVSSLSSRCDKVETPDPCINNALDLSIPSRTPSQSSSTPGAELESCYVCGTRSQNLLNVFAKPISNCPFFPSLLLHARPLGAKPMDDSGKVHVCDTCHKSLLLQWDAYQHQNVPHSSRSYSFDVPSTAIPVMKQENMMGHDRTFVCFTCGMTGQMSIKREISSYPEKEGDQYFSFLAHVLPCPGAEPLINGKASVCSLCYKGFLRQLRVFELSGVPEEQRKYKIPNDTSEEFSVLRQQLKGGAQNMVRHSCFLCDKLTDSLLPISSLPNSTMYFPFLQTLKPVSAKMLSEDGIVEVCKECFLSLKFQWEAFENAKIPNNQRQYRISNVKVDAVKRNTSGHSPDIENQNASTSASANCVPKPLSKGDACGLCTQHLTQETTHLLETLPRNDHMYFPFIHSFLKTNQHSCMDSLGRVLVCRDCYIFLKNQWDYFESARVPHSQRQYRFLLSVPDRGMKTEPVDNAYFQSSGSSFQGSVLSPEIKGNNRAESLLMTLSTMAASTHSPPLDTKISASKTISLTSAEESTSRPITGPLDAPLGRPLLLNTVCFVCAEYSTSTPMYCVNSQPLDNNPFFPFLSKRAVPEGAEKLSPEGCALVCMFCYHSLVSQYLAYDTSPYSEDMNPWQRAYNTYNYVCYICGITTYRQRACSISVRDFPFLSEHPRPMGALTLLGGECVVTCLTCFESLTSQWKDFERMKVPLSMRKYNWIVFPPPPDDEKSRGCQILPGHDSSSTEARKAENRTSPKDPVQADGSGVPHSSKPPPHVPVQSIYSTKPTSRAVAAVSPGIHQNSQQSSTNAHSSYEDSSSSSALNATRTSSFAAALRKLAKQAVDPIAERERSPIRSPVQNQHGMVSKCVSSANSAYNSSHIPVATMPVVTLSPSHAPYELDKRKEYIRYSNSLAGGNSRSSEPVSFKSEYQKHAASHEEQRSESTLEAKQSPLYPSLTQYSSRDEHNTLSHGFQPYRNVEEPATGAPMYDHSPPSSSSLYSYHRPVYQITNASQNYRLEDSVYLERYGMLRPPAVPYPSSTIPYPGMPFYPSNRYPPGLLAQPSPLAPSHGPTVKTERPRSDERFSESDQRVRESHEVGHGPFQSRERTSRDMESNDVTADDKVRRVYSPLSLQISRTESPINVSGRMEPLPYGGPHEMLLRKPSPPSSSSAPLNLVKHTPSVSPYPEEMGKWKIKQHYASNGQSYSSSGPTHAKGGYENNLEHKFHPPPPLISEASQDHILRNSFQVEEPGSRNLLSYSKKIPPYNNREYQRLPEESLYSRTGLNSHHNGAVPLRDTYDNRTLYDAEKNRRDLSNQILAEDSAKSKALLKNGTLPIQDSWTPHNYLHHTDRFRQSEEAGRNPSIPISSSFSMGDMTASHFSLKDASITRALLQNQITPSIIEKYVHASEEVTPQVVSKLDRREEKLRQLRIATGDPDQELSDSESDDDGALKLKEFLVITKGPPLEFKANPQKLGFFKTVGLTTHPKKQYLEWRKYMKRRKMLRDKSCSPIIEVIKEPTEYDENHIAELTKRLCVEDDSETKRDFLKLLGLVKVTEVKQEPVSEPMDAGSVPSDDIGLKDPVIPPPSEKHNSEIPETHFKKRFSLLSRMHLESQNKANPAVVNGVVTTESAVTSMPSNVSSLKPIDALSSSPFTKGISKPGSSAIPPLIRMDSSSSALTQGNGKAVILSQDPRVKLLDRSFAQEFHESVLQATQMQLGHRTVTASTPELALSRSLSSIASTRFLDENSRPSFSWPGIEAIMEAYESYLSEQSVEKEFLIERLQHLHTRNQELTAQITCLGQKTSELAQRKSCLDVENASLQATLDNLKSLFLKLR